MSEEPIVVIQTDEPKAPDARLAWACKTDDEAQKKGVNYVRVTFDEPTGVTLYEGWASRPDEEGPPRFAFVRA